MDDLQKDYRLAIEAYNIGRIEILLLTGIYPNQDNLNRMKELVMKEPFLQDKKESPYWNLYLKLLENHRA